MKKKSTQNLESRLKKYSSIAGTIVAATSAANAQVVYTNIDPDSVIDQVDSVYYLDLNNDLTTDFELVTGFVSGTYGGGLINYMADLVGIITTSSNQAAASAGSNGTYAIAFNFNDTIDDNANMMTLNGTGTSAGAVMAANVVLTGLYSTTIGAGSFIGQQDKFLGLKLVVGGNTHYGWARVDVNLDATEFTIKDYAYESTPNMHIVAGDDGMGGVGVSENGENLMNMKFIKNTLELNAFGVAGVGSVEIYDMTGKKVKEMTAEPGSNSYDLSAIGSGVYLIRANFTEGTMVRKFMLR